jgi:hypothetical protein
MAPINNVNLKSNKQLLNITYLGKDSSSNVCNTYESTWFSNERRIGKGEVLNAHSAIASITS